MLRSFSNSGVIIGPALGGILYSVGGYSLPFWVLGGTCMMLSLIQLAITPDLADLGQDAFKMKSVLYFKPYKQKQFFNINPVIAVKGNCCKYDSFIAKPYMGFVFGNWRLLTTLQNKIWILNCPELSECIFRRSSFRNFLDIIMPKIIFKVEHQKKNYR